MWVEDGKLVFREVAIDRVRQWHELRARLYSYLLLNPDEFAAKCMLEEALLLAHAGEGLAFYWFDVDFQLLEKLKTHSDEAGTIISRLMVGDLYGCLAIVSTTQVEKCGTLSDPGARAAIENDISEVVRRIGPAFRRARIGLHAIKDINKTRRQVHLLTDRGTELTIGEPTHRTLIGIFLKNAHLSANVLSEEVIRKSKARALVSERLAALLGCETLEEVVPYAEAN
jgi:hypothetical protein